MTDSGEEFESARKLPWGIYAGLFFILLLAASVRTYLISVPSYWFDEASSWKTIQYGWDELLTPISRNVHPPFYYIALKLWAIPFGDGAVSLRMFSTAFGLLTMISAFAFVLEATRGQPDRQRFQGALLAVVLLAVSPFQVMLGFNARMYTLATFLAVTCGLFCLRISRTGGGVIDWLVAAGCGTLLTLTHYYGIFTACALGAFMLGCLITTLVGEKWSSQAKRMTFGMGASLWLFLNAWGWWSPYFEAQRSQVTRSYWIPKVDFDRVAQVGFSLLSAKESIQKMNSLGHDVIQLNILLASGLWVGTTLCFMAKNRSGTWLLALAVLIPWLVSISYSVFVRSILVDRYLIFAQTFFLIGLGVLVSGLRPKPAMLISCLLLAWMGFWLNEHFTHRRQQAEVSQLQNVPEVIDAWRSAGDPVLVGTPVIHTVILRHAENPENIYVSGAPDRFPHYQGAPLMRDDEYYSLTKLDEEGRERVFTVDVYGLYGRMSEFSVKLPPNWERVRQQWFQERHGQNCRVFLREYQRIDEHDRQDSPVVER